jgi:hypothetical protein
MNELFVFAGYLGVFLMGFWIIVFLLERLLQKRVKETPLSNEGEDDSAIISVIVAAVEAYEQSIGREVKKVAIERVIYPRKEYRISLWKLKGRVTQMLKREGA